jgi:hypothetical protein
MLLLELVAGERLCRQRQAGADERGQREVA